MEKPVSTSGSGGSSVLNTVFIDTSLNTHLAMMFSDYDTVSDLKSKLTCSFALSIFYLWALFFGTIVV